jgi:hypothetical protein
MISNSKYFESHAFEFEFEFETPGLKKVLKRSLDKF